MVIDLLHYLLMMRRDIWLNLQSKKESKKEQRQKRKIKVPSHHRKSSFYAQSLSWCFESPIRTELNFPISLWPLIDHLPSASIRAWCRGCAFIAYALLGSVGSKWTLDKLRCWIITATRFHYPLSESHALFIQSNNWNVFLLGIKSISDVIYKGKKEDRDNLQWASQADLFAHTGLNLYFTAFSWGPTLDCICYFLSSIWRVLHSVISCRVISCHWLIGPNISLQRHSVQSLTVAADGQHQPAAIWSSAKANTRKHSRR